MTFDWARAVSTLLIAACGYLYWNLRQELHTVQQAAEQAEAAAQRAQQAAIAAEQAVDETRQLASTAAEHALIAEELQDGLDTLLDEQLTAADRRAREAAERLAAAEQRAREAEGRLAAAGRGLPPRPVLPTRPRPAAPPAATPDEIVARRAARRQGKLRAQQWYNTQKRKYGGF